MNEETQPTADTTNRYSEIWNKYRNKLYIIIPVVILLLLIVVMMTVITKISTKKSSSSASAAPTAETAQTNSQTNSGPPTVAVISESPATTPYITADPTGIAIIQGQTAAQISPDVAVPYTVSNVKEYEGTWALMTITNPQIGNAFVVAENVNGTWEVKLGPGTFFSQQDLKNAGAPQALINTFYSPPTTISPGS